MGNCFKAVGSCPPVGSCPTLRLPTFCHIVRTVSDMIFMLGSTKSNMET